MTTMPSIGTVASTMRMASTAAPSAPFLSPRPIHRDRGQGGGLGDADELEGQVAVGALASRHLPHRSAGGALGAPDPDRPGGAPIVCGL